MGCVFSQPDLHRKPGLYKVFNIDDQGHEVSEGYIDIHGSDLILFQEGREPIRWPLRCLRRYGYEDDLFSFESGRRCPTGPGIYAFKCNRTESLFTNLQESILRTGQDDSTRYNRHNPVRGTANTGTNTSNGAPRQGYTALFACHSRPQQPATTEHEYTNGRIEPLSTMRLRQANIVELPEKHDYMNTAEGDQSYENVELGAAYCNVGQGAEEEGEEEATPAIHYIQLVVGNDGQVQHPPQQQEGSPVDRDGDKYTKIDFKATIALSMSGIQTQDESSRRTRHNGTLS